MLPTKCQPFFSSLCANGTTVTLPAFPFYCPQTRNYILILAFGIIKGHCLCLILDRFIVITLQVWWVVDHNVHKMYYVTYHVMETRWVFLNIISYFIVIFIYCYMHSVECVSKMEFVPIIVLCARYRALFLSAGPCLLWWLCKYLDFILLSLSDQEYD